jgi:hypothetical protein
VILGFRYGISGALSIRKSKILDFALDGEGSELIRWTIFCGCFKCQLDVAAGLLERRLTFSNIQNPTHAIMRLPTVMKTGTKAGRSSGLTM